MKLADVLRLAEWRCHSLYMMLTNHQSHALRPENDLELTRASAALSCMHELKHFSETEKNVHLCHIINKTSKGSVGFV